MNSQLSGYRKYYDLLIYNRICTYNEGIIKNRFFLGWTEGGMGGWPVDTSNSPVSRFEIAYLRNGTVAEVRHKQGIAHDTAPQSDQAQLSVLLISILGPRLWLPLRDKVHRVILAY
jgi:hypothetical protein